MASLCSKTHNVLKSTAPARSAHGDAIATRFYDILFTKHPDQRKSFNMRLHRQSNNDGAASLQVRKILAFLLYQIKSVIKI